MTEQQMYSIRVEGFSETADTHLLSALGRWDVAGKVIEPGVVEASGLSDSQITGVIRELKEGKWGRVVESKPQFKLVPVEC